MDDQCNDDVVSITSHGASVLAVQVQIGNSGHLPHLLTLPDFQPSKLLDHVGCRAAFGSDARDALADSE